MNSDTSPSAQTLPGISRQRKKERAWSDMGKTNRKTKARATHPASCAGLTRASMMSRGTQKR